jgi:hypothetical protein
MMAMLRYGLLILLGLFAAACTQRQVLEKVTWPEDRDLAVRAIHDVQNGDANALADKLPPELRPAIGAALPRMRAALPDAQQSQIELVDGRFVERLTGGERSREAYLAYEISGGGSYALAQVTIIRHGGPPTITSLFVNHLAGPVSSLNRFTLLGKSAAQYAILMLAIAAVAVTVAALVRVWRSGRFGRRWLWTIGCLIGLTTLSVNWTTGKVWFRPIYLEIFSAGFVKSGLGPWIISAGIPLVALYVLLARRGLSDETEEQAS